MSGPKGVSMPPLITAVGMRTFDYGTGNGWICLSARPSRDPLLDFPHNAVSGNLTLIFQVPFYKRSGLCERREAPST